MSGHRECFQRVASVATVLSAAFILSMAPPFTPASLESAATKMSPVAKATGADGVSCPVNDWSYDRLPLTFELNHEQASNNVTFFSRGSGYSIWLTATEAVLALQSYPQNARTDNRNTARAVDTLRIRIVGANQAARLVGRDGTKTVSNYFLGGDPSAWRTDVPTYSSVRCDDIYPGVDLVYYGTQRELEYDFTVAPGVEVSVIAFGVQGANYISIDDNGDLVLRSPGGEVRHRRPILYQEVDGEKREISGGYVLKEDNLVGFEVETYNPRLPLVIDPVLSYSTYLGGNSADEIRAVAVDTFGSVYVTGNTISTNFYGVNAVQSAFNGPGFAEDAFVAKLNPEGTALLYSTYLGGHGSDLGLSVAVDSSGNAYVTGQTTSNDFPTTPGAFQTSTGDATTIFVAKLSPVGNALSYSTYLSGRSGNQRANAIAVNASGNAYVTGRTSSADFPTTASAFQRALRGFEDAFVTKLDATGSTLAYSTLLGGDGNSEEAFGISVDAGGFAYVVGHTGSTNFPTSIGAVQRQFGGGNEFLGDAFVTKLSQSGATLVYSTYLGGSEGEVGAAIAVDAVGEACVTGTTRSSNFPTANAIQSANASGCVDSFSNCTDAFVTKLSQSGGQLVYSTYLGGGSRGSSPFQAGDSGSSIAVDQAGNAFVTGTSSSTDFPIARAFQSSNAGNGDAFVVSISASGSLLYSTYLGGPGDESASSIATSENGAAFVAGIATSAGFPTTLGAFQIAFNGSFQSFAHARDGFIARISSIGPLITSVEISGKHLIVFGANFDSRAVILLDGDDQKTKRDVPDPTMQLIGKKTGKRINPGQTVKLRVRNGDGGLSAEFLFTRPAQ
jgi:hypothetical protein